MLCVLMPLTIPLPANCGLAQRRHNVANPCILLPLLCNLSAVLRSSHTPYILPLCRVPAEFFTSIVRTVGMRLAQGEKLPSPYLDYLQKAVEGLRLNSAATWAWLTGAVGMSVAAAADLVGPVSGG
jgi:hypothetical protein